MRGGFNHPLSPSFTPSENQDRGRIRWHLDIAIILATTRLDAFDPFFIALFISQVTTGYDPTFILKGAFGIR
jgi:hypothetical protein